MSTRNTIKLIVGLTFFTLLSGFHGCTVRTGTHIPTVSSPSPTGSVVVTTTVEDTSPDYLCA
jgi:hypothetical protein